MSQSSQLSTIQANSLPVAISAPTQTMSESGTGIASAGISSTQTEASPTGTTLGGAAAVSGEAEGAEQTSEGGGVGIIGDQQLSASDRRELQGLRQRDREVRAHERAHKAVGGRLITSSASFEYQKGPDGRLYAVGGEVGIDTSEVANNPEATVTKMQQVRRAALAPADPSPQDRRVASAATQKEARARIEISELQRLELQQATNQSTTEDTDNNNVNTRSVREYINPSNSSPSGLFVDAVG